MKKPKGILTQILSKGQTIKSLTNDELIDYVESSNIAEYEYNLLIQEILERVSARDIDPPMDVAEEQ